MTDFLRDNVYQQLSKMQRCHINITMDVQWGVTPKRICLISHNATDVRQVLHRIVDCCEHTHLKRLEFGLFCPSGKEEQGHVISAKPTTTSRSVRSNTKSSSCLHATKLSTFSKRIHSAQARSRHRDLWQPLGVGLQRLRGEAREVD